MLAAIDIRVVTKPARHAANVFEIPPQHRAKLVGLLSGCRSENTDSALGTYLAEKKLTFFAGTQCCDSFRAHNAYAGRQIAYVKGSKKRLLTLRRYLDRVLIAMPDQSHQWQNLVLSHSSDCPVDRGDSTGRSRNRQATGGGDSSRRSASRKDLAIGRPARTQTKAASKKSVDREKGSPGAREPLPDSRDSRLLLTAVAAAGLHILSRPVTDSGDMSSLVTAAVNLGRPRLPAGVKAEDTWAFNTDPSGSAVKARLDFVGSRLDKKRSPTMDVVVLLTKLSAGRRSEQAPRTAELIRAGAVSTPLTLLPSVKFWRDGRTTAATVYLALLHVGLDSAGNVEIISGYAHPVLSKKVLCPIDSDEEKRPVSQALDFYLALPEQWKRKFRIEKPIFARRFGRRWYTLDLLVFKLKGDGEVLALSMEHLGYPKDIAYVERKYDAAREVVNHSEVHVLSVSTRKPTQDTAERWHVIRSDALSEMLKTCLIDPLLL
jgi:hypothetical protein